LAFGYEEIPKAPQNKNDSSKTKQDFGFEQTTY
jgi:hypothetical protein